MLLSIGVPDDYECNFHTRINVKPMYADALLWDVMDMQSNKDEPLSLRAIGAFALFGMPVIDTKMKMESLEISELECFVKGALKSLSDLLQLVKGNEEDWFYAEEKKLSQYYQNDALRLMILLQSEKYAEAMEYVSNSDSDTGGFENKGSNLYVRVIEYCRKRI